MDFNLFAKNLARIGLNFSNLAITEGYVETQFSELQRAEFTDQDFLQSVEAIINHKQDLFSLPTKALFLKYSTKKTITDEQMASIEVDRIIEASQNGNSVIFDNETTNAALHSYGGIGTVYFDLFSTFNDRLKERHWVEKNLREKWLNCKVAGTKSNKPSYYKGCSIKEVKFIGDSEKCRQLLDQHNSDIKQISGPRGKCLFIGDLIKDNLIINNKNKKQNV